MLGLRTSKQEKRLPRVLSVEEVARLLQAASGDDAADLRHRAILETLYSSGMRVGELVALKVSDVDFFAEVVTVMGKRRKERVCPLGSYALRALEAWLARRGISLVRAPQCREPLFLNLRGTRLTDRSVARMLAQRLAQANLGAARLAAHAAPFLRHAPARPRRRPALRPGTPRARQPRLDANLHPPLRRAPQAGLRQGASAGEEISSRFRS